MAKRNFQSTDLWKFLDYAWPISGQVTATGATKAVALSSIEGTDVVVATVNGYVTASYVTYVTITSGTGFVINLSAAPGSATVSYAVFKVNQ
jgi:hypothetical protein